MIHRTYFDFSGNSVDPEHAVTCHEIETDVNGRVIAERNYSLVGTEGVQFNQASLEKMADAEESA